MKVADTYFDIYTLIGKLKSNSYSNIYPYRIHCLEVTSLQVYKQENPENWTKYRKRSQYFCCTYSNPDKTRFMTQLVLLNLNSVALWAMLNKWENNRFSVHVQGSQLCAQITHSQESQHLLTFTARQCAHVRT